MIFIIGGRGSGKLEFVKLKFDLKDKNIGDGMEIDIDDLNEYDVIYDIDQLIRRFSDKEDLDDLITDNENASIIVANEIEDGIAPADEKEERGRKLLRTTYDKLEEKADTVIYMMAGVPKYLKGEKI